MHIYIHIFLQVRLVVVIDSVCLLCAFCAEYVAMYTYESSEQGDLSFQQGDIVMVTRKEGDWWTGMVGGKTGVFPSNYVKPRDSASEVSWTRRAGVFFKFKLGERNISKSFYSKLCFCFQSLGPAGKTGSLGKKPGELSHTP